MEEYTLSILYYVKLLKKWRTQFIVVTVVAILASAVFSSDMFIKPRYKSSATVYPANVIPFSGESTTEQILQMLESNYIRDAVIRKYNLAGHYEIDTTAKDAQTQ